MGIVSLHITSDGSPTLYNNVVGEHYHSVYGARAESEHIFIQAGLMHVKADHVRILEVGLGTALNMLLTAGHAVGMPVTYHAVEKYPLPADTCLQYTQHCSPAERDLMARIHNAPWNTEVPLTNSMTIKKIEADITSLALPQATYNVVYFDAFSPERQPEMWSEAVFENIYNSMECGGVLVTYCSKGIVKRALKAVGFAVERLPGPPHKRHILRATKL